MMTIEEQDAQWDYWMASDRAIKAYRTLVEKDPNHELLKFASIIKKRRLIFLVKN